LRVIDVKRGCVVDAPQKCRYVALSYVWGDVEQLCLTRTTYDKLSERDSIRDTSIQVAQTIRDALYVCNASGERYLCVDSLCIIQDSESDKHNQMIHMDYVYTNALLTLVDAAGSNANSGLAGVRPGSRTAVQHIANIDDIALITTQHNLVQNMTRSRWYTRGWTLQEQILSRRLVVFTRKQIFFACQETLWREDTLLEKEGTVTSVREKHFLLPYCGSVAQSPDISDMISRYKALVTTYLARDLSREQDILNAFEGILKTLVPVMGNFIFGLPERYLDTAMIWDTEDHLPNFDRKGFPSWTWAGWTHSSAVKFRFLVPQ
jgi:hypothetical protein